MLRFPLLLFLSLTGSCFIPQTPGTGAAQRWGRFLFSVCAHTCCDLVWASSFKHQPPAFPSLPWSGTDFSPDAHIVHPATRSASTPGCSPGIANLAAWPAPLALTSPPASLLLRGVSCMHPHTVTTGSLFCRERSSPSSPLHHCFSLPPYQASSAPLCRMLNLRGDHTPSNSLYGLQMAPIIRGLCSSGAGSQVHFAYKYTPASKTLPGNERSSIFTK